MLKKAKFESRNTHKKVSVKLLVAINLYTTQPCLDQKVGVFSGYHLVSQNGFGTLMGVAIKFKYFCIGTVLGLRNLRF